MGYFLGRSSGALATFLVPLLILQGIGGVLSSVAYRSLPA